MSKPRILVIDDESAIRDSLKMILEYEGYQFIGAASGQDGLTTIQRERPDAVLLDMNLPGTDGLAFVSGLRRDPRFDALPVIALTAHAMRGDRERFLAGGCDGYLPKPIDTKSFVDAVAAHVTRGRSVP